MSHESSQPPDATVPPSELVTSCGTSSLQPFWETDIDLDRAELAITACRFSTASIAEEWTQRDAELLEPEPQMTAMRMRMLLPLALITVVAVFSIVRWPTSAQASLVVSLSLGAFVVVSALVQLSRTQAQYRENLALRVALRKSQREQQQLRFPEIVKASRPAA